MSAFPTGKYQDNNDTPIPEYRKVNITYDPATDTVYISAPKSAFVPKYLDYVLEYLHLPKTAKRVFEEDIIPWENPDVVKDLAEELINCSTYGFKQEVCGKAAECITYLMNKYLKKE